MRRVVLTFILFVAGATTAWAQENTDAVSELSPLGEERRIEFDQRLDDIAAQRADIARLSARLPTLEGLQLDVQSARIDLIWANAFRDTVALAEDVLTLRDAGVDVSAYTVRLRSDLEDLPIEAIRAMDRIAANVVFPGRDMPSSEIVVKDQQLLQASEQVDEIHAALVSFVEIAERYGLDESDVRAYLVEALSDSADGRSAFLRLAREDVQVYRAAAAALPDDTVVPGYLAAAEARVRIVSSSLQDAVDLMNRMGLDTRRYRQQLLTTTGEITADVLDVGIVASLVQEWSAAVVQLAANEGPRLVFRLLLVVGILMLFWYLGRVIQRVLDRALGSNRSSMSALLRRMIVTSAKNIIVFIGILVALSQLGISLGPLLAGVGIAGFIVGFALQDSLSNFASGLMILLYRPFDLGDYVEAGGVKGTVSAMSLVNTTFHTFDNQKLVVPNNKIWQSVIVNFTAQETRRVDLEFGISYEDDIEKAEKILEEIVQANEAVLDHPPPLIRVNELGEYSVRFIVRPWVKTDDYWPTYWAITREVKFRFDEAGISFPLRDLRILGAAAT